jgi:Bacteriophage head to tail connecting protein.
MPKAWKDLNEREKMQRRMAALKHERAPMIPVYQELSQQFAPANGRFFNEQANRTVRDYSHVVDATGLEAIETSVAGLMSIASSPARPWLRYTTRDPDLDEFHPVQTWMADAAHITLDVYANNNTYLALPGYYRELLTFATAAGLLLPHFQKVVCHYPMTCGEYCLQQNPEGEINTLLREYHMTVAQIAKRFGLENCSKVVNQQWKNGELDQQHHIAHLIEPREDRDESKLDAKNMAWRSVYWEVGNDSESLLDDSGYERFPVLAPRWDTVGGDIYGTGPGNRALPHSKRLQIMTKRLARGIHQQMDPATLWPTSMKGREIDTNPGGRSFGDIGNQQGGVRTLADVRPQLDHMLLHLQDIRNQLNQAFFANFFAKVSNDERNDRATAAEIHALKEEAWLMLGPFAQRIFSELLSPMTQITFERLLRNGGFPPPPPELFGREISVKMISPLAQAQEAVGAVADDRYVFALGQVAALKPAVLHSFNEQKWAERYPLKIGADPELVRPAEEVAQLIDAQNKALAAKEQTEVMESQSKAVKNLGTTPSAGSGDTALADVSRQLAGAGA